MIQNNTIYLQAQLIQPQILSFPNEWTILSNSHGAIAAGGRGKPSPSPTKHSSTIPKDWNHNWNAKYTLSCRIPCTTSSCTVCPCGPQQCNFVQQSQSQNYLYAIKMFTYPDLYLIGLDSRHKNLLCADCNKAVCTKFGVECITPAQ